VSIEALRGWLKRTQVSMGVEMHNEQTTRQYITKWISVMKNPNSRLLKDQVINEKLP